MVEAYWTTKDSDVGLRTHKGSWKKLTYTVWRDWGTSHYETWTQETIPQEERRRGKKRHEARRREKKREGERRREKKREDEGRREKKREEERTHHKEIPVPAESLMN